MHILIICLSPPSAFLRRLKTIEAENFINLGLKLFHCVSRHIGTNCSTEAFKKQLDVCPETTTTQARERERERDRESVRVCVCVCVSEGMCVCVCVLTT